MTKKNIWSAAASAYTSFGCVTAAPQRILVVDDNEDIRRLNVEALLSSGYEVDSAEDGALAWDALNTCGYDLLITDNNMPNMTGLELLRKVQNSHMALPVIMASGTIPTETFAQNPWLRPAATLCKPHTLAALLNTVRNVLRAPGEILAQAARPSHWPRQASAIQTLPLWF